MSDRTTHQDLLLQVADSAHERVEVRRALGDELQRDIAILPERKPCPPHGFDADDMRAIRRFCAGGPCDQGRKRCPTPDACGLAAEADEAGAGVTLRDFWDSCTPGAKIGWAIVGAITIASLVWHVVARMA